MTKFILKFLLFLIIIFSISLGIDAYYRQQMTQDYYLPKSILPKSKSSTPYQIVALGNSHADDGITFEGYKLKGLKLTGVAQRFNFDLALLKHHANEIDHNAIILINVSPISFSHKKADRQDGLQNLYYGRISPFLIPDLNLGDYIQSEIMPSLRAGYLIRQKYEHDLNEQKAQAEKANKPQPIAELKKPKTKQQELEESFLNVELIYSELASHSAVKAGSYSDNLNFLFNKWNYTEEFDQKYFEQNKRDLEKLISYSLKKGWRPVLISVPISSQLVEGLQDDFMSVYFSQNLTTTNTYNIPFIDLSNQQDLTSNQFLYTNADHLNQHGAKIYSYLLLQELIKQGYLTPEVDGYYYPNKPTQ